MRDSISVVGFQLKGRSMKHTQVESKKKQTSLFQDILICVITVALVVLFAYSLQHPMHVH